MLLTCYDLLTPTGQRRLKWEELRFLALRWFVVHPVPYPDWLILRHGFDGQHCHETCWPKGLRGLHAAPIRRGERCQKAGRLIKTS